MSVIKEIENIKKIKEKLKSEKNLKYYHLFNISINTGCSISNLLKLEPQNISNHYLKISNKKYYCNKKELIKFKKFISENNIKSDELVFLNQNKTRSINRSYFYEKINTVIDNMNLNINFSNKTCEKTFGYHFYKETNNLDYLCYLFNKSKNKVMEFIELEISNFKEFSI